MKTARMFLIAAVLFASVAFCDVYLQGCVRGSNNRMSATGNNNNRLFNSQNNNAGGSGIHPKLTFYAETDLELQWTNQHGCGNNPNVHCNMVLQYMCASTADEIHNGRKDANPDATDSVARAEKVTDVDDANNCDDSSSGTRQCGGPNTDDVANSQTGDLLDADEVVDGQVYRIGQHENFEYYEECLARDRNGGLFTADENVDNNDGSTATRQNPNGDNQGQNNNGLECQEERDYYPYWHYSPWVDIAVITDDTDRCDYYKAESQNVKPVNRCSMPKYNNKVECEREGGNWEIVPSKGVDAPDCLEAAYTRDNHLGNAEMKGRDGVVNAHYTWRLPNIDMRFCVVRIRYNISSGDYDGWTTDHTNNDGQSPITDDPRVPVGYKVGNVSVHLNIDVTQFGRTFQDRSHVFGIQRRPDSLEGKKIHNVNVRGERGNIVQTYPNTEYDFCPTNIRVNKGDYIHFQFAGTDSNPDNQAGNGKDRTDRFNMIEMGHRSGNYPVQYTGGDADDQHFFGAELAAGMGFLGQTDCDYSLGANDQDDAANCYYLNRAPRYFSHLHKVGASEGEYHFASSRNNDFTNRSQKMTISVGSPAASLAGLAAWVF